MSTVQDTDLLLVNRAGVDYKCTVLDWKNSQKKAPTITSVTLADSPEAGRFTSGTFRSTVVADDGKPAATKGIKAWVQGTLKAALTSSHAITATAVVPPGPWHQIPNTGLPAVAQASTNGRFFAVSPTDYVGVFDKKYYHWNGSAWVEFLVQPAHLGPPNNLIGKPLAMHNGTYVFITEGYSAGTFWVFQWKPGDATGTLISRDGTGVVVESTINLPTNICLDPETGDVYWGAVTGIHKIDAASKADAVVYNPNMGGNHFRYVAVGGATVVAYGPTPSDTGRIGVSHDRGATWKEVILPGGGFSVAKYSVCYSASAQSWALADANGHIWTSLDAETWTDQGLIPGVPIVQFLQTLKGTFWAFDGTAWHWSLNGKPGTWTQYDLVTDFTMVNAGIIYPSGSITGTLTYNYTLYAAPPAGLTWLYVRDDLPVAKTKLTLAGAYTDGFRAGDMVHSSPSGAGPADIQSISDTEVVVFPSSTAWAVGQKLQGEPKVTANAKLYCKLNAGLTVTDLQSADPGYTAVTGAGPYTVTFPATLPTGAAPDVDLPAGTTITTELQAVNSSGTVTKTSNTITPA